MVQIQNGFFRMNFGSSSAIAAFVGMASALSSRDAWNASHSCVAVLLPSLSDVVRDNMPMIKSAGLYVLGQ